MSYIRTYSGKNFDILNLSEDAIDLESIVHGLSNTCRFSGQSKKFYSVAEHSCRVAAHVYELMAERHTDAPRKKVLETVLWGLLHDASEAYLPDMPTPFKRLPELAGFRQLEDNVMAMICQKFGMDPKMPAIVKEVDSRIIQNEKQALMHPGDGSWDSNLEPLFDDNMPKYGMSPEAARLWFMDTYDTIVGELNSCDGCPSKRACHAEE